jgi:hypothetical protein
MIDVERACGVATKLRNEPYVDVITDIGNGFVIGTMSKDGEVSDVSPVFVNKADGKTEIFFIPDNFERMQKGKQISVPSKYRFNN